MWDTFNSSGVKIKEKKRKYLSFFCEQPKSVEHNSIWVTNMIF